MRFEEISATDKGRRVFYHIIWTTYEPRAISPGFVPTGKETPYLDTQISDLLDLEKHR